VVHAQAGKGRTGTAIAAYLIYSGLFSTADKALRYFACKRSITMWGVTNPSQVRYVSSYFSHLLITTKRLRPEGGRSFQLTPMNSSAHFSNNSYMLLYI
jgi:phosphatidylinositol-3,4,5-trisphosphate 3-phosphatase/dual-specificity protein phosphatase PTEN